VSSLFGKNPKMLYVPARRKDPRTSHAAARINTQGRATHKDLIVDYLRSIAPQGACATCIWKALGKPTKYPNGLSPRFAGPYGLLALEKVHRLPGVMCKLAGHEGVECMANSYGPEIDPAFKQD
jgi:hypothetical protein